MSAILTYRIMNIFINLFDKFVGIKTIYELIDWNFYLFVVLV